MNSSGKQPVLHSDVVRFSILAQQGRGGPVCRVLNALIWGVYAVLDGFLCLLRSSPVNGAG
jgi:hypothetical protein